MERNSPVPWRIAVYPGGIRNIQPRPVTVKSVKHLERLFKRPPVRPNDAQKSKLDCWSPALYPPGKTRSNKAVRALSALVYDFDDPVIHPRIAIEQIRAKGLSSALHTTWSHTRAEPRYRVILFVDREITPSEFQAAWYSGLARLGFNEGVDRQCRDISRMYILPMRRRESEEYVGEYISGKPLSVDSLKQNAANPPPGTKATTTPLLLRSTKLELEDGSISTVAEMTESPAGKYKCKCPFQKGASPGSAFLRIMEDKRAFLLCTSERHAHLGKKFWLRKEGRKKEYIAPRSVSVRKERLAEVPGRLQKYCQKSLSYLAPQGVFYRRVRGAWKINEPMPKERLVDHLVGLLKDGGNKHHAMALVDDIISRQVYGFDVHSEAGPICMSPEGPVLNLYAKPTLKPAPGKWDRIAEIVTQIVNGDSQGREWLLHWSAALAQRPERRSMVAVLSMSPHQGVGKSMYGRILAEIIGPGNAAVVSNRALRDKFNASYANSLLVLADEVGMDNKATDVLSELKTYITDEEVYCAAPYVPRMKVTNRMSWWMTSNKRRPLILETHDRRLTVFCMDTPSRVYLDMLRDCFNPRVGGFEPKFRDELSSFADYLQNLTVNWKLISRPFETEARRKIQDMSETSIDGFARLIFKRGFSAVLSSYPPPHTHGGLKLADSVLKKVVPCETLYASYQEWCHRTGCRDISRETILRTAITEKMKVDIKAARVTGQTVDVYVLKETRAASPPGKKIVQFPGGDS